MTTTAKANAVSSFTIIKGALIPETYAVLRNWDLDKSASDNFDTLRQNNTVGAGSSNWLRDVIRAIRRRLDPGGRDRQLVRLAKSGCTLDVFKPILLWHITRGEFLLRDFLIHWLYPRFREDVPVLRPADVLPYLSRLTVSGTAVAGSWTETTARRVAQGLLLIAADFGLLTGVAVRRFSPYSLPEPSLLYLLHAIMDDTSSAAKTLDSPDWRMYLMSRGDVENELLRLHQFRKVHYESAGSIVQLELPCRSVAEYTERLVA
jgi:hypothetical protein